MRRHPLFRQLFLAYLAMAAASVLVLGWYASASLRAFFVEHTASELEARARLVEKRLASLALAGDVAAADALAKELGAASATRITVVLPSGSVVGDSAEDPARMDNHADRVELMEAFAGRVGVAVRYSHTLDADMIYVAVPVVEGGNVAAAVRASARLQSTRSRTAAVHTQIAVGALVVTALAAVATFVLSRRLAGPLEEMTRGAERFASGDFSAKLHGEGSAEAAELAAAMNHMAADLDARIRDLVGERNEREAILSSMVEGVIAVDAGERVISMNGAAAAMLGARPGDAVGRTIQEAIRNPRLQDLAGRTLAGSGLVEDEIVLRDAADARKDRILQAHGAPLAVDAGGRTSGAVIVLDDVTRARRLETVRREFVANVSHELRTPLTAIRGFVETLQDASLPREKADHFLDVVARQVDRMNAIVEDLLLLARVEEHESTGSAEREDVELADVLSAAVEVCGPKAGEKGIAIEVECRADRPVRVDGALLEQAVVNLVDNAVKYSDPNKPVRVEGFLEGDDVVVRVIDHGRGIEAAHLDRIFERFYRVDKGRSRELGGTGLGLSIVKHVAQMHGGAVTVTSSPGAGSTFTIRIPSAAPADARKG